MLTLLNSIDKSSVMRNKMWYKNYKPNIKWNSLSKLERQCINDEFYTMLYGMREKFTDPCKEPVEKCLSFCKNSKISEKHMYSNKRLTNLLLYISHPTNVTVKGSQLLPFCSVGNE